MEINPTTLVIISFIVGNLVLILTPLYYLDDGVKRVLKKSLHMLILLVLSISLICWGTFNKEYLTKSINGLFN